jgi:hypothetical protein
VGGDISKYTLSLTAPRRVRCAEPAMGDTPEDDGPSSCSLGAGRTGGSPTELAVQGPREWPNPSSGMGLGRAAKGRSERSGTTWEFG